jgi:hypothetical protein
VLANPGLAHTQRVAVAGSEGVPENGRYVEPRGHTPLMPAIVSAYLPASEW